MEVIEEWPEGIRSGNEMAVKAGPAEEKIVAAMLPRPIHTKATPSSPRVRSSTCRVQISHASMRNIRGSQLK